MIGRPTIFILGATATLGAVAVYHGPMGKADEFAGAIEQVARAELDRQEMVQIDAKFERGPLRRTLVLSGPADDFQREELPKIIAKVRGVEAVRWDPASLPAEPAR